ncbi:TRAP transporter small permease [Marinobacter sp. C2H3]|uniref:TRAP transporter small permease n=1 Tax=Marinobacter sp. C2H3 TaxID=3119003 RepID=UPI00300EF97A
MAHTDRAVAAVLKPVLAGGIAALIAVITLQIVSRVLFSAVGWTEEVARFLLVWLTFLGAVLAWAQRRHIVVTVLVDRLPPSVRRWLSAFALACAVAALVALAWIGYQYMMMQSYQKSASLRVPMMYIYAVIPLSAALMALLGLADLVRVCLGWPLPGPDDDSAADSDGGEGVA